MKKFTLGYFFYYVFGTGITGEKVPLLKAWASIILTANTWKVSKKKKKDSKVNDIIAKQ